MPAHPPDTAPEPGERVSLRRVLPGGGQGDLVGFVLAVTPVELDLTDRRGFTHHVPWREVVALRRIDVARGRDPLRAPRDLLDELAARTGVAGRVFVIRLVDLLKDRRPPGAPLPAGRCEGEWITVPADADFVAAGWWGARKDARSMQVRTGDPLVIAQLLELGFAERG